MTHFYRPPQKVREWTRDIADGELYQLTVFDNRTVCLASGRFAHSSGSKACSWEEFLAGSLNEIVLATMEHDALDEAIALVRSASSP